MTMLMLRTPMMMVFGDDGDDAGVSGSRVVVVDRRGCVAVQTQWADSGYGFFMSSST